MIRAMGVDLNDGPLVQTEKLLAAMRHKFGEHAVKQEDQ
jgi:6-phosphogluconate dehydrogenase (decarboxylating)